MILMGKTDDGGWGIAGTFAGQSFPDLTPADCAAIARARHEGWAVLRLWSTGPDKRVLWTWDRDVERATLPLAEVSTNGAHAD